MREAGASSGLVEIGGEVRTLGRGEGGRKWVVRVHDPRPAADGNAPPLLLRLADQAVATSGDYARYFSIGGRRYSHLIDPRTGRPVGSVPSVTVVAPDASTADALATGISVLGPRDGVELADSLPEVECMVMAGRGEAVRLVFSRGFAELMEESPP
jgi:thiamine biosynthesis lipoprotein